MAGVWVLPLAVVAFGLLVVSLAVHQVVVAATALRVEAARLTEVGPAVAGVRNAVHDVQEKASVLQARVDR